MKTVNQQEKAEIPQKKWPKPQAGPAQKSGCRGQETHERLLVTGGPQPDFSAHPSGWLQGEG